MKNKRIRLLPFLLLFFVLTLAGCCNCEQNAANGVNAGTAGSQDTEGKNQAAAAPKDLLDEDGSYTSKEDVALYIYTYRGLPNNFITKKEAQNLGWDSRKGNLTEVAPGKSIGGTHFGNYEGQLPDEKGRKWTECDIDYTSGNRNAKRIVFSNDGLIYYTDDHYKNFEILYK